MITESQCFSWLLLETKNGVMVSTTEETSPMERYHGTEFHDKNTFRLITQSHEFPLAAILCEQGNNALFVYLLFFFNHLVISSDKEFVDICNFLNHNIKFQLEFSDKTI